MRLENMPEVTVNWSRESPALIEGARGHFLVRARRSGEIQQRIVDYAPGYVADHWCLKGHVLYVLSGELTIEHEDGSSPVALAADVSWSVGDGERPAHRVRSEAGARVFIVD